MARGRSSGGGAYTPYRVKRRGRGKKRGGAANNNSQDKGEQPMIVQQEEQTPAIRRSARISARRALAPVTPKVEPPSDVVAASTSGCVTRRRSAALGLRALVRQIEKKERLPRGGGSRCQECGVRCDNSKSLYTHRINHHPKLRCDMCDKPYMTQKKLTEHKRSCHPLPPEDSPSPPPPRLSRNDGEGRPPPRESGEMPTLDLAVAVEEEDQVAEELDYERKLEAMHAAEEVISLCSDNEEYEQEVTHRGLRKIPAVVAVPEEVMSALEFEEDSDSEDDLIFYDDGDVVEEEEEGDEGTASVLRCSSFEEAFFAEEQPKKEAAPQDQLACRHCQTMVRKKSLYDHDYRYHPESFPLTCDKCPRRFRQNSWLENHQRKKHGLKS